MFEIFDNFIISNDVEELNDVKVLFKSLKNKVLESYYAFTCFMSIFVEILTRSPDYQRINDEEKINYYE